MSRSEQQFISTDNQQGVAYVTLNRPPINLLHIPMLNELEAEFEALARNDRVRVLILQAEGKIFSAGVDVGDHTREKVREMIPLFNRVCRALAEFPVPTLASVHGHALGGGCELVLCCDLAVMAREAKLGQPEIQLAAIAPIAALRLPYLTGYRVAADLMFTGRSLSAEEAMQTGLINAVAHGEQIGAWTHDKATHLAGLSRAATVLLKKALRQGYKNWADSLPNIERLYLEDLMNTADAHEGLAAFMEKRDPQWTHK